MARKLSVAHKLARLIPTVRRLHDSALEANAELHKYVQENESLRAFMEKESEKYNQLNVEQKRLKIEIENFEIKKSELIQERKKTATLQQSINSLEATLARENDLKRIQSDLFAEFSSMQDLYSKSHIESRLLKKKLRKRKRKQFAKLHNEIESQNKLLSEKQLRVEESLLEIDSLTEELALEKSSNSSKATRIGELDELVSAKLDEIDVLTKDMQKISTERQEQEIFSLQLKSKLDEKTQKFEELVEKLDVEERRYLDQLNRSLELEGLLEKKRIEAEELAAKLDASGALHQGQLNEFENFEFKLRELQDEIVALTNEVGIKTEKLDSMNQLLNDSHHFANVRSEEALARILGKLSQIDYTGNITPLSNGNVPLTNYSTQEVVLGKYFDLLIGTLTGTINEDEPISPWSVDGYDPEVRSIGRDWPATACSMIGTVRMTNLQRLVCDVIENNVEGDAIETGVWRGGACILMKSIFNIYGCHDRKVWVADSFQGLPKPEVDSYKADENDIHHTFEHLKVSKEQVEDNFRKFGALDDNVVFLEGWFKDTLHEAPINKLAILRLDGDMEESTLQALNALYHKVSKGGYVIIDDYGLGPCRKAVDDFRTKHDIKSPLFEVDAACVYWQVG